MKLLFISFFILFPIQLFAGSCCGGGASSAQIMMGPTQMVLRSQYSNQTLLADSNDEASLTSRNENNLESIKTWSNSLSYRISELSQIGLAIPIIEKTKNINNQWTSYQSQGDLSLNYAYEFYPEYSRNQFITQSFISFQITLPTAPSLYTTKRDDLLDTTGQGHYLYTSSLYARKKWQLHDLIFQGDLTYRPAQSFQGGNLTQSKITTKSSLNHKLSMIYTYNLSNNWSLPLSLTRDYIGNKASSVFIGKTQSSLVYQSSIGAIFSTTDYDFNLNYTDEMLIGPSQNHTLGKSIAVGVIKRYTL